jgi:hypothetical protein
MIARRPDALWAGWGGTALFVACWLLISWISAFSFLLWVGLMSLGAAMCFYGAICRSKWFFFSAFAAVIVMTGVLVAVYRGG